MARAAFLVPSTWQHPPSSIPVLKGTNARDDRPPTVHHLPVSSAAAFQSPVTHSLSATLPVHFHASRSLPLPLPLAPCLPSLCTTIHGISEVKLLRYPASRSSNLDLNHQSPSILTSTTGVCFKSSFTGSYARAREELHRTAASLHYYNLYIALGTNNTGTTHPDVDSPTSSLV